MDKNFVNVDDLVRQRLGGGEEKERAGAWGNMKDLLDKEMPQERPVAAFFWRNTLSVVAVLLLLGTAGIGGYRMLSASEGQGQGGTTQASASPRANGIAGNAIAPRENGTATPIANSGTAQHDGGIAGTTVNNNDGSNNKTIHNENRAAQDNSTEDANTKKVNTSGDDEQRVAAIERQVTRNEVISGPAAPGNIGGKPASVAVNGHSGVTGTNKANVDNDRSLPGVASKAASDKKAANTNGEDAIATGNPVAMNDGQAADERRTNVNDKHEGTKTRGGNGNNTTPTGDVLSAPSTGTPAVAVSRTHEPVTAGNTKGGKHNNAGTADREAKKGEKTAAVAAPTRKNDGKHGTEQAKDVAAADNKHAADTKNSTVKNHAPAGKATAGNSSNTNKQPVNMDKMALASNVPANSKTSKTTLPAKTASVKNSGLKNDQAVVANASNATRPAANNASGAGAKNKTADVPVVPVFVTSTGARIPGDKLQRLNMDKARQSRNTTPSTPMTTMGNKKVTQKLDVFQHFVKTSANGDGFYKLDTVSIITITEEMGITTEVKGNAPSLRKAGVNSSSKNRGSNANNNNDEIVPNAAPSKNSMPATREKGAESTNKKSGTTAIENLNSAFNDIKYKVSGMQFAPGLTAGINGTFFGPSSFKGFQFGFAGNFVFSDAFSVMTELKYFHRVNGSYALNDDYYTYTPNGAGGYKRQLESNTYAFSTLHSFELPIAARFSFGKFGVFAGGNLLYTMGINAGAAKQADPNNVSTVAAIGNDNAPKLTEDDLKARFGFGYLCGASFQVSPNLTMDFRNVQTLWDNAASAGAKTVSAQLYKSPSLQFSLSYRLGGNKHNKE